MRLPRFRLRTLMIVVAAIGVTFSVTRWLNHEDSPLPASVLIAAQEKVPGFRLSRARREWFNGERAWELQGTNNKGEFRRIDVSEAGKVLMIENH